MPDKRSLIDTTLMLGAAKAITDRITTALAEFDAEAVTLSRDEAALTQGLLEGLIVVLEGELGGQKRG